MFVVCGARIVKLYLTTALLSYLVLFIVGESKRKPSCLRGTFNPVTGICTCVESWYGERCQNCRQRLTAGNGTITDIQGETGYSSSKCLWVITAERSKSVIELNVELLLSSKQPKCTWYILYVYNGPSFRAPLLAAFSGITRDNSSVTTLRSTSSTVLIYFYCRDTNIDLHSGFKIKYSIINNCTPLCDYRHGKCNALGKCICSPGWTGITCEALSHAGCPYSCIHGTCNLETYQCDCNWGFSGPSCNTNSKYGTWNKHIAIYNRVAQGRAAHAAGVVGDWLWIYGGYSLIDKPFNNLIRYSFSRNTWETHDNHGNHYGHSLVVYNSTFIIFGGISKGRTVNEVWSFKTIKRQWTKVQLSKDSNFPIAVSGHTATIVNTKMIVLFGYGSLFGFTPYIQVYDIVTNKWTIMNSTLKEPTYGHTSHYDPVTKLIYVHGGRRKGGYSNAVHSYNLEKNHWTLLSGSKSIHVLHSSVLIGNMLIVYGGYTFIDGLYGKCCDTDFMVYDIICDKWSKLLPTNLPPLSGSFGQSAVVHNSKMYIFGGFNGIMKNDLLSYSLGNCSLRRDETSCQSVHSISGCLWYPKTKTCLGPETGFSKFKNLQSLKVCTESCSARLTCGSCNAPGVSCQWCDGMCRKKSEKCFQPPSEDCQFKIIMDNHKPACKGPDCHNMLLNKNRNTCLRCTERPSQDKESYNTIFMWCSAKKKCIDTESYSALLPNGQCNNWISTRSSCQDTQCSAHSSCNSCHSNPGCGWCDDDSGTGVGRCVEGGADKPYSSNYSVGKKTCPRWYFMDCPVCQCNGHSICLKGKACSYCKHHTTGRLCHHCKNGYFGNPRNGGTCSECECNGHAKYCHHITSKCVCLIEGIRGDKCEICHKDYEGNATNGQTTCYYKLTLNSRKIFNVSGKTGINIQFTPLFKERDISFDIEVRSGKTALMNITYVKKELSKDKEMPIFKRKQLGRFNHKFSHRDYSFHKGPITFRAYIYNIDKTDSVKIIAQFEQPSTLNINLLEFFLTFFGCFLSLLFVASIGWRIRSRYHSYLVTRQRRAERDRMANRPFATVHLLLPNELEVISKSSPSLIAVEPLSKNKVAIATVVVLLPNGEEGVTPVGQCGVCFGSMIMSHAGHQHLCLRSRMGRKKTKKRSTMITYQL